MRRPTSVSRRSGERRIAIKAHLKPFFVCYAGDISEIDIEAYKRGRTKVSPATINNELKVLSCVFKFGIAFGYLVDMPKIKRLKVPIKILISSPKTKWARFSRLRATFQPLNFGNNSKRLLAAFI